MAHFSHAMVEVLVAVVVRQNAVLVAVIDSFAICFAKRQFSRKVVEKGEEGGGGLIGPLSQIALTFEVTILYNRRR